MFQRTRYEDDATKHSKGIATVHELSLAVFETLIIVALNKIKFNVAMSSLTLYSYTVIASGGPDDGKEEGGDGDQ